jgi:16S rRNA (cytosine967-C5)-methyltransferase
MPLAPALPNPPLARLLAHAADAVQAVAGGQSLTDVLARVDTPARPGTQAIAFHALRWWGSTRAARAELAARPPPPFVDALLCTALALLWPRAGNAPMYAEHTVVDQAVAAARQRAAASAPFVNAALRRFLREREAVVAAAEHSAVGAYNHPAWWIERLKADWPMQWQAILRAAQQHPPMTLRVNARRCSAASYQQRLATLGRASALLGGAALVLDEPCPVQQLPGFAEGEVSVQDLAAQRAAPLLVQGLSPRARVLDACAAPGGKSAHLLELADLELLALDVDAQRLQRVHETLLRLGLQAEVKAGDARLPAAWWDGRPFDAILLDAPCSASGIVRRHPDVRWLRRADDIAALVRVQQQMLQALWPLLAPGGRLLYATCSVFKAEGEHQLDAFLQRLGPAAARLDAASPGHLLPLADNAAQPTQRPLGVAVEDGFYYALLHKNR